MEAGTHRKYNRAPPINRAKAEPKPCNVNMKEQTSKYNKKKYTSKPCIPDPRDHDNRRVMIRPKYLSFLL